MRNWGKTILIKQLINGMPTYSSETIVHVLLIISTVICPFNYWMILVHSCIFLLYTSQEFVTRRSRGPPHYWFQSQLISDNFLCIICTSYCYIHRARLYTLKLKCPWKIWYTVKLSFLILLQYSKTDFTTLTIVFYIVFNIFKEVKRL